MRIVQFDQTIQQTATSDVGPLWWVWIASALVILAVAAAAGVAVRGSVLGVLIDTRGRCSLARFHILWWTTIILSLVMSVAAARFSVPGTEVLGFTIPAAVLGLLGVGVATGLASSAVKAYKNANDAPAISASPLGLSYLGQMLTLEEGAQADQTLDVGKLQSLLVTVLLGLTYVLTCIHQFLGDDPLKITGPKQITTLPDLNATFVGLLAISGAHYVGMKTLSRAGFPAISLPERNAKETTLRALDTANSDPLDGKSLVRRRKADAKRARREANARRTAAVDAGAVAAAAAGASRSENPFPTACRSAGWNELCQERGSTSYPISRQGGVGSCLLEPGLATSHPPSPSPPVPFPSPPSPVSPSPSALR